MVCAVEVLESTPFCTSPVISDVIRDALVWADWVQNQLPMPYVCWGSGGGGWW